MLIFRVKDSVRFSFEKTKRSVINPRCPLNGLSWRRPRFSHVVVFFKKHWSFRLCFTVHSPGASIYRLKGTSKQPVASSNVSGSLGCLESNCKHLTLKMEVAAGSTIRKIDFSFSYLRIYSKISEKILYVADLKLWTFFLMQKTLNALKSVCATACAAASMVSISW